MHFRSKTLALLALLTSALAAPDAVTIYAWPLSAPSPEPLASVRLHSSSDGAAATLVSFTPPKPRHASELVRVGLYDAATGAWRGSATSAAFFGEHVDRAITLHVDGAGVPYHVDVEATDVPDPDRLKKELVKKAKKKDKKKAKEQAGKIVEEWRAGETTVVVWDPEDAPAPALNKPVVLNDEGMVKAPLEQQRTFMQK
jgi:hypothetical protein